MKKEKPRKEFTLVEFREDSKEAFKSAELYGGVNILDADGKISLSLSLGTRDTTCRVCNELPDWCEDTTDCIRSWKLRARKAETKLHDLSSQLEIIAQEMFW